MTKHKSYNAELKLQMVLKVLKRQKSLAEICREHEIAVDLVCHWRDVFLEGAIQVFVDPCSSGKIEVSEQRIAELERMAGRLAMELDVSKRADAGSCPPVRTTPRDCKETGGSLSGANPV